MNKTCTLCEVSKPLEEFRVAPTGRLGRGSQCKACLQVKQNEYRNRPDVRKALREADRARYRANPPSPEEIKRQRLWTWYRITPEQYANLLESQGGRCAVQACGATEPGGQGGWHVDHDHACCPGKTSCGRCVRGLLCARCNPMLGFARDDTAVLLSAADYLTFNAALSALGAIGG